MQLVPNLLIIPVGIVIGILVSAPVGPVNVLCIQRAIERGFFGGLAAGLGAMLGDGLIALFASLGVGAISGAIEYHHQAIQIVGGLALVAFGIKLYVAPVAVESVRSETGDTASLRDYAWDIPKTFFLTITNPGAVLGLFGAPAVASLIPRFRGAEGGAEFNAVLADTARAGTRSALMAAAGIILVSLL